MSIQLKRGTTEALSSQNPIILDGQLVVEKSATGIRLKIGDGSTAYNDLPYIECMDVPQETIDEINNAVKQNLAYGDAGGVDWSEVIDGFKSIYATMSENSTRFVRVNNNGANLMAQVYKCTDQYGTIFMIQYAKNSITIGAIGNYEGVWDTQPRYIVANGSVPVSSGGVSYDRVSNYQVSTAIENGWMIQHTVTSSTGGSYRIGFDSSTGIYAANQGTGIQFWNIRPYSFKKASVYFSSGSASISATGVTTSSTILATRGDSNLSGGNYGGIGAADCISNGTISLGATNSASATWTVNLFWCK